MKRREFIIMGLGALASITIPIKAFPKNVILDDVAFEGLTFDPSTEWGMSIQWYGNSIDTFSGENGLAWAKREAERFLPNGTPYEVRQMQPQDYGLQHGIAWYYSPAMYEEGYLDRRMETVAAGSKYDPLSNCYILHSGTVEDAPLNRPTFKKSHLRVVHDKD